MIPGIKVNYLAGGAQTFDLSFVTNVTDESNGTGTYGVTFQFQNTLTGGVNVTRTVQSDPGVAGQYISKSNGVTYYVRCTQNSGQALNVGDTLSTWLSLESAQARSFGLSYSAGSGFDQVSANVDFEIARDSGGTDIVATASGIVITVGNTG